MCSGVPGILSQTAQLVECLGGLGFDYLVLNFSVHVSPSYNIWPQVINNSYAFI